MNEKKPQPSIETRAQQLAAKLIVAEGEEAEKLQAQLNELLESTEWQDHEAESTQEVLDQQPDD